MIDTLKDKSNKLLVSSIEGEIDRNSILSFLNELESHIHITLEQYELRFILTLYRKWKTYLLHLYNEIYTEKINKYTFSIEEIIIYGDRECINNSNSNLGKRLFSILLKYINDTNDNRPLKLCLNLCYIYYEFPKYFEIIFIELKTINKEASKIIIDNLYNIILNKNKDYHITFVSYLEVNANNKQILLEEYYENKKTKLIQETTLKHKINSSNQKQSKETVIESFIT